jgi:hypothetical protein
MLPSSLEAAERDKVPLIPMSDIVLVALISAGGAVAVALMTQFLATRAASRQADRRERQEERHWQRSEAVRKEVRDRAEAARLQALRDDRLRELWGHVLTARWLMLDRVERSAIAKSEHVPGVESPASAAAQAYAVALLGLVAVRPAAAAFYEATAKLQLALQAGDDVKLKNLPAEWNQSFKALENGIATLVDWAEINALSQESEPPAG